MSTWDGLNGLYHFDNDFLDSSGNGRDLTNSGATFETGSPILGAASSDYNGLNSHSFVATGTAASDTEGQVAFWYKSPTNTGDETIISFDDGANIRNFIFVRILGSTLDFIVRTANTTRMRASVPLPAINVKHAVIFGVDSGGNYINVDGADKIPTYLNGNASTNIWLGGSEDPLILRVGARKVGASISTPYDGLVDELAWSDRRWTDEEDADYWNGGVPKKIIEGGIKPLYMSMAGGFNQFTGGMQ